MPHWVSHSPCSKCWLTNLPTLQRQILVLLGRPVHVGQLDKYQATLPSVRGRSVVMQTLGATAEKQRSEEALYIALNSNTSPPGLCRDAGPELEKYSAPENVFRIGLRRSVVHHPGLANSQHREDMSKAPPSLTLGSALSAVFGGRKVGVCSPGAHASVGRTRAAAREDSKPASAVNRQLVQAPLYNSTFFDCLRTCQYLYS